MDINIAKDFLKKNPVFWSRLGFCYDPPLKNKEGRPLVFNEDLEKFAKTHRSFAKAGVKIHSSVLHLGWVGVNEYDYSLTDRVLDAIFKDNPDIYYIPRIKLNVPVDWCYENPEDVFVYYGGPKTAEEIKRLVGTEKHDYFGYEAPNGYYASSGAGEFKDTRPNVGGVIARQSFSSKKWLYDAGIALRKLMERIENGKYGDRILGYHIAYGLSGETIVWGRMSDKYGDYGINNTKEFIKWGERKYGNRQALAKAWGQSEDDLSVPFPEARAGSTESLDKLMRAETNNQSCIDYDLFVSETNADAMEYFANIVKEYNKDKLVGIFYGYVIHIDNPGYAGHLAIERLLNSPYIDFFAAPKSYYRCKGGEPGGELAPAQSISLKKIWVDETDVRTFLAKNAESSWGSDSAQDTICILRREFSKNIAHNSSFWWMDLGGGWYDSDILMDEIEKLTALNNKIQERKHKSISDVLIVIDENCINHMRVNTEVRRGFMEDFICEANMSGALVDVYRLSDFENLEFSQYKLIIFAYCFQIDEKTKKIIKEKIPKGVTVMYNYAAGVLNGENFSLKNIKDFTGFDVYETKKNVSKGKAPCLAVAKSDNIIILEENSEKEVILAKRSENRIINLMPFMKSSYIREIARQAGCTLYTEESGSTVYGDNRFIGIFTSDGKSGVIKER